MSRTDLTNRVILVTGAGSGLGLAASQLAVERGATVVMSDLAHEAVGAEAERIGAIASACDVADATATERLVAEVVAAHGRIDGLVNAAGVMQTKPFMDISPVDFDRVVDVNLRGTFFLAQATAKRMVEQGAGSMVLFSSTAGRAGRPLASHYAAAKAGILNLTRSASVALAPFGVRVNAVCPGLIETPMIARIREERSSVQDVTTFEVQQRWETTVPMGRLGEPKEVASAVIFLLSDAASYITGEQIGIAGGTDGS